MTLREGYWRPVISYLGLTPHLSPPQLAFLWVQEGETAEVRWLWRFEEGPIQWDRVMQQASESDLVFTVVDAMTVDNQHNREFQQRMRSMPRLGAPTTLEVDGAGQFIVWIRPRQRTPE